jgi:DNA repair protein RadC
MKPREKLQEYGVSQLSDEELISLILIKGTKKENIFEMSQRIIQKFDHDELINVRDVPRFMKNFNTGYVQSTQLIAVFELGKRYFTRQNTQIHLRTSEQVYEYVKSMENLSKEHVKGLYLDCRYKLIHEETISIGDLNSNILHPREILKPAIENNAYAFILVHNHPSGDPNPSAEDKITTEQLTEAAEILHIPLLDHLVIGKNSYKSIKTS